MKAIYKTINFGGRLAIEAQGETAKDLFREIASAQEVFDAETSCGCCQSLSLRLLARRIDDFDFYELACLDCHARFAFGQAKKGGALFPKRKDQDGNWLPNRGWAKWEGKHEDGAPAPSAPATAPATAAPFGRTDAAKQEKRNGVPVFASWTEAEASKHWGDSWLDVAGKLYQISESGAYREVQRTAAK